VSASAGGSDDLTQPVVQSARSGPRRRSRSAAEGPWAGGRRRSGWGCSQYGRGEPQLAGEPRPRLEDIRTGCISVRRTCRRRHGKVGDHPGPATDVGQPVERATRRVDDVEVPSRVTARSYRLSGRSGLGKPSSVARAAASSPPDEMSPRDSCAERAQKTCRSEVALEMEQGMAVTRRRRDRLYGRSEASALKSSRS